MASPAGRCAILFPHGVLFRDEERDMRERIVAADLVEAVIGLGPNLFYNSPMEACIVVCQSRKTDERRGKVLFIDALKEVTRERAQSFLTPEHIARVVEAYRAFNHEPGFSAVATLEEIADREANLSIPLYVRHSASSQVHDLDEVVAQWRVSSAELRDAVWVVLLASRHRRRALMSIIELPAGWMSVAFGDVVRQVKDRVDPEIAGIERYVAGEHMETDDLRIRHWGTVGDGYLGPAFHMRFQPGHVLYGSRRTYLRKVAVADFEGICANTTFVLEPSTPELLPEFLPLVMTMEAFHAHSIEQSKGSVNPYINFRDLTWFEFALPPVEEQREIGRLMHAARQLTDALTDVVLAARTQWMALAIEAMVDTPACRLEAVAAVDLGKKRDPKLLKEGAPTPYLRAANVKESSFSLDDVLSMNFTPAEIKTFELQRGDVLVTEGCGSLDQIGACAVWNDELPAPTCFQMTLLRLRPRVPEIMPLLHHWAEYAFRAGLFAAVASGTSVFHLSAARVRQMSFPELDPGRAAPVVAQLDRAKDLEQKATQALESARQASANLREALLRGDR